MINVLLVDDHVRLRRGVRELLEASGLIRVLAEAPDAASGVKLALRLKPDVVVTDLQLPDASGLVLVEQLARMDRPIPALVLSLHCGRSYIERVTAAGAAGFVSKWTADEQLLAAIVGVHLGQRCFGPIPNDTPDEQILGYRMETP